MVETGMRLFFQAPKGRNMLKGKGEILEGIFKKLIANSLIRNKEFEIRNHLCAFVYTWFNFPHFPIFPDP